MIKLDHITEKDIKEYNPSWPQIPDHSYRILIVRGSGSGKINALLNLIIIQSDIDNIYVSAKDPCDANHQQPINKKENAGPKHFNYSRVFIQNSSNMDGTDKNIEEYNSSNKQKILIVFDYKIVDMLSNKKLN